ncbi:MAG: hypothetical protein IJT05_03225 [Lachnospiraceae bacterium]|nr:hypothetical protein [Lachnospiraceae bacterium]
MNISGIRPYTGFYENRIENSYRPELSAQNANNEDQAAKKAAEPESGVIYEHKRPEALTQALSEMKEDRVLQQYQFFAKSLSTYDPSLAVISGENFNV